MKKLGALIWVIIYTSIYLALQLTYLQIIGFVFKVTKGISGEEENIEQIVEGFLGSQSTGAIVLAGITALLIYYVILKLRRKDFSRELKFNSISLDTSLKSVGLGVGALAVSAIVAGLVAVFMESAILDHMQNMDLIMSGNIYIVFLAVAVVAPIIEEIIFRGLVYRELEKVMNIKSVVVIQGILFGLYHLNVTQGIYASILGIILGLTVMWTGSIWVPIIVHIVNNSLSFTISQLGTGIEAMVVSGSTILIGIIIFPILMRSFYKNRVNKVEDEKS